MMIRTKRTLAICYFTNSYYKEYLKESLKGLQETIKRDDCFDVLVKVFDDTNVGNGIDEDEIGANVIVTSFKRYGIEQIREMFKYLQGLNCDYVMLLEPNFIPCTFDYIEAISRRVAFNDKDKLSLGQIGSKGYDLFFGHGCQVYTKNFVNFINHFLSSLRGSIKTVVEKRIDCRGDDFESTLDVLLDMFNFTKKRIESVEGLTGYENYKDTKKEDLIYPSVFCFHNVQEMKEFNEYFSNIDRETSFQKFVKGKTVAVVGNADVDKDYSEEIDNHDIVIRINNFYNYHSGLVGKKIDALILGGLSACIDNLPNGQSLGEDIIKEKKPRVFLITESSNQKLPNIHNRYSMCKKDMLMNKPLDMKYTTGTLLLKQLYEIDDVKVDVYGFTKGSEWKEYLSSYCSAHKNQCTEDEEEMLRQKYFEKFNLK
jgi:hypothetical protein